MCKFVIKKKPIPFVWSDMGFCYLKMNDISKAKIYLFKAKKILKEKKISYLAPTLSYIGDYYIYVQNNDSALYYYKNSLNIIENYKVYTAIKPSLLEKISKIYIKKNNFREAVFYLKSSKNSYEDLFSISGKQNKRLFEIKNNYKQKIDLQKRELKNRETVINHKNSILLRLVMIIFILIIGLIFVYVFIQQRNKIKRLALAQEFNREKNKEILNVKNKELASYSLKMIELNDIISSLLKEIKKIDLKVFGNMSQRFGKSNGKSWKEFDKRFIEVNSSFYSELCRRHPDLSPSELRHCTLIKLNLDNIEIAKLLNISQQSLHTARYRIRKKLELRSSSDLTRYINNIK